MARAHARRLRSRPPRLADQESPLPSEDPGGPPGPLRRVGEEERAERRGRGRGDRARDDARPRPARGAHAPEVLPTKPRARGDDLRARAVDRGTRARPRARGRPRALRGGDARRDPGIEVDPAQRAPGTRPGARADHPVERSLCQECGEGPARVHGHRDVAQPRDGILGIDLARRDRVEERAGERDRVVPPREGDGARRARGHPRVGGARAGRRGLRPIPTKRAHRSRSHRGGALGADGGDPRSRAAGGVRHRARSAQSHLCERGLHCGSSTR